MNYFVRSDKPSLTKYSISFKVGKANAAKEPRYESELGAASFSQTFKRPDETHEDLERTSTHINGAAKTSLTLEDLRKSFVNSIWQNQDFIGPPTELQEDVSSSCSSSLVRMKFSDVKTSSLSTSKTSSQLSYSDLLLKTPSTSSQSFKTPRFLEEFGRAIKTIEDLIVNLNAAQISTRKFAVGGPESISDIESRTSLMGPALVAADSLSTVYYSAIDLEQVEISRKGSESTIAKEKNSPALSNSSTLVSKYNSLFRKLKALCDYLEVFTENLDKVSKNDHQALGDIKQPDGSSTSQAILADQL